MQPGNPFVEPATGEDVRRNVAEREWLLWLFATLEHTVSLELRAEMARLREDSQPGVTADQVVHECSERLLSELQRQVERDGLDRPEPALGIAS